jgi:hypothetical protein
MPTLGRLDRKTFTDTRIPTVSYTYDSATSQMKTVTDGRGLTSYSYDNRDRVAVASTSPLGNDPTRWGI